MSIWVYFVAHRQEVMWDSSQVNKALTKALQMQHMHLKGEKIGYNTVVVQSELWL